MAATTTQPAFVPAKHIIDDPTATTLDLYDWNAVHNAACPHFRYLDADGTVRTLTWADVNAATHRAAAHFTALMAKDLVGAAQRPVLAIFASIGALPTSLSLSSRS